MTSYNSGAGYSVPDINTRSKKLGKWGLAVAAAVLVSVSVLFSGSSTPSPLSESPSHIRSATVSNTKQQSTSVQDFPGSADEIDDLFGKPDDYTSRLYSGYLPLRNGGEAFYFFAESQSAEVPEKDPVLLWLNGGPGGSSLAGCFSENGPLLVAADGQHLTVNEYAWNKNANFICVESPIGVGFSYNKSGEYVSDDLAQAADLYDGLQQFFTKFPHLRENDFIISGESYGGIYVPTTARAIVEGNLRGEPKINLKKFVVGNGMNEFSGLSQHLYAYYHGITSTEEYENIRTSCPDLQEFKATLSDKSQEFAGLDTPCGQAVAASQTKIMSELINSYDVTGKCAITPEDLEQAQVKMLLEKPTGFPHPLGGFALCLDWANLETYFNIPSVRKAMHTNAALTRWYSAAMSGPLAELTDGNPALSNVSLDANRLFNYTMTLNWEVTPIWTFLLAHDVRGVIYHGDADMVCDFISGLWAVESLKLPRKGKRATWSVELGGTQQAGGFVEKFKGLTYVTVKGAGHMVPTVKPVEAKRMLDLFVLEREG